MQEFLDARRLTGPNLLGSKPASVLDVRCSSSEVEQVVEAWQQAILPMLDALGWGTQQVTHSQLLGGVSLAFTAPIDALYAAVEINEWAWACINDAERADFELAKTTFKRLIEEECNPRLLEIEALATQHDVPFLWDDDEVSLGQGTGTQLWPFRELPEPTTLNWQSFQHIPIGIVTGTNGKTTTVRMAKHILRVAQHNVGVSCTDWIAVNDHIIERGDWSGPGGARAILRQQQVEVAVLEAARGGLLRRGLGVSVADAALITNIAEDHLGDFGSQNLQELLNIKWVVSHAVETSGTLVLNADDEILVQKAEAYSGRIVWFSLDANNPVVQAQVAAGGSAYVLEGAELLRLEGTARHPICGAADIPITLGGAAKHNVANALAAAALTSILGVSHDTIVAGLKTLSQDANPGRSNLFEVAGAKVLLDFAHNPHAMRALFSVARSLPAKRRLLVFGQAGDRPDAQIRQLASEAWSIGLDAAIVSELAHYHRGRNHGEVYTIIADELRNCGAAVEQILYCEEERESLVAALEWAQPGDLIIMLALGDSASIQATLANLSS